MKKDMTEMQFTAGISYQEHIKRADKVYETIVKPQVIAEKKLEKSAKGNSRKIELTPAQKALSHCPSPI